MGIGGDENGDVGIVASELPGPVAVTTRVS